MTAVLVSVAEAVKEEILLIPGLVRQVDPERSYADWDLPLDEFDQLRVDVVPVNVSEIELDARGVTHHACRCYIAVRYRFRPEDRTDVGRVDVAEIDDLLELLEQFNDYFMDEGNGRRLSTYSAAAWKDSDVRTWYMREHLRELAQYTGIIDLTYEVAVNQ